MEPDEAEQDEARAGSQEGDRAESDTGILECTPGCFSMWCGPPHLGDMRLDGRWTGLDWKDWSAAGTRHRSTCPTSSTHGGEADSRFL